MQTVRCVFAHWKNVIRERKGVNCWNCRAKCFERCVQPVRKFGILWGTASNQIGALKKKCFRRKKKHFEEKVSGTQKKKKIISSQSIIGRKIICLYLIIVYSYVKTVYLIINHQLLTLPHLLLHIISEPLGFKNTTVFLKNNFFVFVKRKKKNT